MKIESKFHAEDWLRCAAPFLQSSALKTKESKRKIESKLSAKGLAALRCAFPPKLRFEKQKSQK